MHLLLIEDDGVIGDGVKVGLTKMGFTLDWFTDGLDGEEALTGRAYDAVILDLTLPGADGFDILTRWRAKGFATPVLILTARSALDQRVEGLNLGADDYLIKPFALVELAARLRALIRRAAGTSVAVLSHGRVSFNPDARTVSLDGTPVSLSPKELLLVELFLLNKTSVLSKNQIEEKIYPWGEEVSSNAVEVHVHHVRRKLGSDLIKTVHGIGYRLGEAT